VRKILDATHLRDVAGSFEHYPQPRSGGRSSQPNPDVRHHFGQFGTLAEKLKALRARSGKSLQQVADAVGVSKAYAWELESGEKTRNPTIDVLTRLADFYLLPGIGRPIDQRAACARRAGRGEALVAKPQCADPTASGTWWPI
jgi:transcriptional regulator with XRE-family HTH domain